MNNSAASAPPSYEEATTGSLGHSSSSIGPPYPLEPHHRTPTFNVPPYPRENATLMPQPQIRDNTTFPPYATGRSPSPIIPVNVLLNNAQNRPLNAPQSDIVPLNAPNSTVRPIAHDDDCRRKIPIIIAVLIVFVVIVSMFARF